jgi:hypothetical protein
VHSGSCELEWEITPNSLEVHQRVSLTPNLLFGTWFQWFGGHLQRGRILGLLQPVRGALCREDITFQLGTSWVFYILGV